MKHFRDFIPTFDATSIESRKHFIQICVLIAEALNTLFLPLHSRCLYFPGEFSIVEPGINPADDVIRLREVLIFLRNKVFEHPLSWQRKKLANLLDTKKPTTTEIFKRLMVEMRLVEARIADRINLIGGVLRGEGDWREILVSLFERYRDNTLLLKEPGTDVYRRANSLDQLEKKCHWQVHPLPTFQGLRRYFFYTSFCLPMVIETDPLVLNVQKKSVLKSGEMLSKTPLAHTWGDLDEC